MGFLVCARLPVSIQASAVSGQRSAVSGQRSAVSGQRSAVSRQLKINLCRPMATLRERENLILIEKHEN
ncbi:hypothetical protein [Moorena producens]|uniref:hypothetical protein n=1 Tax=Moorena producens TaxID=1155739 RepID=UPI000906E49F|nr:hypothetical protein [Moorena producens]